MAKRKSNVGKYTTYIFKDHDPILDIVDDVLDDAGLSIPRVEALCRISSSTLHKWRARETKQPRHDSVKAVLRAAGARYVVMYKGKIVGE